MKVGAQFYTLRDSCTDLDSFAESLKRVADIGYTEVQISGVCPYEPEWLRDELKKNGLKCVLTHYNADEIRDNPRDVVKFHDIFDCKRLGIGCMPGGASMENLEKFLRDFPSSTKAIAKMGSKLHYHHHHWEFAKCEDGERMIEKIIKTFPENELGITVDTYWVQFGGCCPQDFIKSVKGRAECVHLKDFALVGSEQRMAAVGEGNLNIEKIVEACEEAGTIHLLVEQDNCYGKDPFDCLKQSYNYLKALGLN